MTLRRYRVSRRAGIVRWISHALELGGAEILRAADPHTAPFEYTIRAPSGELQELVCYAFTANKYQQQGRPSDEHRFQVKYGSAFDEYHDVFIDPDHRVVTLLLGVHADMDLAIGVDPAMHSPTRFSTSVEFKQAELDEARRTGWHGWERDRSAARRRNAMPMDDLRTEVVIAVRPEHFLRYVAFERLATGMDSGERLLLADRVAREIREPRARPEHERHRHPLEIQLGLPAGDILDVIGGAFRLLAAVRGGVAEHHLGQQLRVMDGVEAVRKIDEDGRPDFEILYRGRKRLIECKNVLRRAAGAPRVDFQKTRAAKGNPCSRYYTRDQFDVLAACLHPVSERWEFRYCATRWLPAHTRCAGRLSERVIVSGASWHDDLRAVLDSL